MYLINLYRTFYPNATKYTFSSAHAIFSRIHHMLGQKKSINGRRLKSYRAQWYKTRRRKLEKSQICSWLNNMLLNNCWVNGEIKSYLRTNEDKNATYRDAALKRSL